MNKYFMMFCGKTILFLLLIAIADYGVGFAFTTIKDKGLEKNPENMWLKTAFVVEKVDADVIIVGSSKASHHYVPDLLSDSLNLSVYNCGQDGCFYLYQNCIINMVLDRYNPKMIIWDIQPDCFDGASTASEYQNMRYLSPYYNDNKWVKSYIDSESNTMNLKMLSNMFAYNSKVFNYIVPLMTQASSTRKGYIPLPNTSGRLPELDENPSASAAYLPNKENFQLLAETILRCIRNGVQLKLVVSPEYRHKPFSFTAAVEDIREVAQQNNIQFEDYSSDLEFMKHPEFFKDVHHLNDNGAKEFTKRFVVGFRGS